MPRPAGDEGQRSAPDVVNEVADVRGAKWDEVLMQLVTDRVTARDEYRGAGARSGDGGRESAGDGAKRQQRESEVLAAVQDEVRDAAPPRQTGLSRHVEDRRHVHGDWQ